MKEIWKFQLDPADSQTLSMPTGAQILTVQVQRGIPCLWALVDPSARQESRNVYIIGTGHSFVAKEKLQYVGTYQLMGGDLVWHVFVGGGAQ